MYTQKSFVTGRDDANKKWWVIDGTDMIVGRLASEVATLLRGKHKPTFTPNQECGDFVVITNADKVKFTGNKLNKKNYYWHTGFIGGIKSKTAREMMEKTPERVVSEAVKGMLPKKLAGKKATDQVEGILREQHNHEAQKPEKYEIKG